LVNGNANGTLCAIWIAREAGGAMAHLDTAHLVAGRGIEGDRYFDRAGTFSPDGPSPDHELTLVAKEEVTRFLADAGLEISAGDLRRNLLTEGVDLNAWVGKRFRIADVELEGIRLCEPCRTLADQVGQAVLKGLVHRAGLRARVVSDGRIRVGDRITAID
jgi:MOSC domain-containing protein YiiM